MIESDWLRAFAVFAEDTNLSRTAKRLHLSQPAVHAQLKKLSSLLGVPLYQRAGRGLVLTREGVEVAAFARDAEERALDLLARMQGDPGSTGERRVVLAAGAGALLHVLGEGLRAFSRGYEGRLEVMTADGAAALDAVTLGVAHAGVTVASAARAFADLEVHPLTEVEQQVVVPKGHPLARRRRVTLADLDGERLVMPPEGRPQRVALDAALAARGARVIVGALATGWELTLRLVELGSGLAIVNASVKVPRGLVARPLEELARVRYVAITRRRPRDDVSRLVRALVTHAEAWRAPRSTKPWCTTSGSSAIRRPLTADREAPATTRDHYTYSVVTSGMSGATSTAMRSSSLLWLVALLPTLVACGADTSTDGDNSGAPPSGRRDDDITAPRSGEPVAPGAPSTAPGSGGHPLPACIAQPTCNGAGGPELGLKRAFTHTLSQAFAATGPAFHRGRDQIYAVGDAQWIIGKMTYSYLDKDLTDEDVDIFVERGCGGSWEKLGTAKTTTNAGLHPTVEGVADDGGRVFFQIPADKTLSTGRHRVRLVVAGDQTSTDLILDVVPKGTPIVVSDVDGTLTDSETAEYPALLSGSLPNAQPHAADALAALAGKGYHVVYLTARPEWLTGRTHQFLAEKGFPRGVVHTTTGLTGAIGSFAATFKSLELGALAAHGHTIAWAFGNKPSDTDAYEAARINPVDHRVFLQVTDAHGGRRIENYAQLLPTLTALAPSCK